MECTTDLELRRLRVKYQCARERFHSNPTGRNYSATIEALRKYVRSMTSGVSEDE